MKRLGVFIAVSLVLHLLLLFISWPSHTAETETDRMLTMVDFTPVSKNEPATTPTQPAPQPQEPVITPTPTEPAPIPTEPTPPEPQPEPASQPEPQPEPTPAPIEEPQETISEPQEIDPQPVVDTNTENTPAPDNTEPIVGEVDIAAVDNSTPAAEESNLPAEEASPESTENTDAVPSEEPAADTDNEAGEEPAAEILIPAEPESQMPSVETGEESPVEEPQPEIPEELDGRVDVPNQPTFVSDRIQGHFEFAGQGRRLVNNPSAPNFRLTRNTTVKIPFKIDSAGRPFDIRVPPLGSSEVEQMLRTLVGSMRFSAVLYSEPDEATFVVNLQVR